MAKSSLEALAIVLGACCCCCTAWNVCVVGGGAAGFFSAVECARTMRAKGSVTLLEGLRQPLSKVEISGGGRCNVMHDVSKPISVITQGYPRGEKQLLGPFSAVFGPQQTYQWFKDHGVDLKTESDGRMFPTTDSSQTVIDALQAAAQFHHVEILCGWSVSSIKYDVSSQKFAVQCKGNEATMSFDRIIMATGSSRDGYRILKDLGHSIKDPLPSLFTFTVKDAELNALSGLSVPECEVSIVVDEVHKKQLARLKGRGRQLGPLLLTHTGLSGPAVLKLSAYCAELLAQMQYKCSIQINWVPSLSETELREVMNINRRLYPSRAVSTNAPFVDPSISHPVMPENDSAEARDGKGVVPRRLWRYLVLSAEIDPSAQWAQLSQKDMNGLLDKLRKCSMSVSGRGTFRDEFVTCGGVPLKEVDMKTMQSAIVPGLFLAGEVLDIDGITGGYNFQSAWTTGWIAGRNCGQIS